MFASCGIIAEPTAVKNLTAQSLVEHIHAPLAEALHTKIFENDYFKTKLDHLLLLVAYALCTTVPTTIKHSKAELTFGVDMIFHQKVIIDWDELCKIQLEQSKQNNKKENKGHLDQTYKVDDWVLIITPT